MQVVSLAVCLELLLGQLEHLVYALYVDVVLSLNVLMANAADLEAALGAEGLLHSVAAVSNGVKVAAGASVDAEILAEVGSVVLVAAVGHSVVDDVLADGSDVIHAARVGDFALKSARIDGVGPGLPAEVVVAELLEEDGD